MSKARSAAKPFYPVYAKIAKVDEEQRMVFGYASTEAQDAHGEIIRRDAIAAALPEYMQFGNIREMHQPSAVGKAVEAEMDETGLWLGAKVVDDDAWKKVKEGVYGGFSIGGRATGRDPLNKKIITAVSLSEISLVDRPANPDAVFEMWKSADVPGEPSMSKSLELIFKGDGAEGMPSFPSITIDDTGVVMTDALRSAVETVFGVKLPVEKPVDLEDPKPLTDAQLAKREMRKGMWQVAVFAQLLTDIRYLMDDVAWEAAIEQDGSPLAADIKTWLQAGAALLVQLVAEEAAELADIDGEIDVVDSDIMLVQKAAGMLQKMADLRKARGADAKSAAELAKAADDIAKAGKRNSKADQEKIQEVHDHSVKLGADCGGGDVAKSMGASVLSLPSEALDLVKGMIAAGGIVAPKLVVAEPAPVETPLQKSADQIRDEAIDAVRAELTAAYDEKLQKLADHSAESEAVAKAASDSLAETKAAHDALAKRLEALEKQPAPAKGYAGGATGETVTITKDGVVSRPPSAALKPVSRKAPDVGTAFRAG